MTDTEETEDAGQEIVDVFTDVADWAEQWLLPALEGKWLGGGKGHVLCPQWWRHRMVVLRLGALWREWEKCAREDALSGWWVYHFDAHARALFDGESGPMYACTPERHRSVEPLTTQPPPTGWFDIQPGTQHHDEQSNGNAQEAETAPNNLAAP